MSLATIVIQSVNVSALANNIKVSTNETVVIRCVLLPAFSNMSECASQAALSATAAVGILVGLPGCDPVLAIGEYSSFATNRCTTGPPMMPPVAKP